MGSELDLFILTGLPATVVAVILASAIAVLYSKKSASFENSIQEWKFPHVTVENGNVIAAITQGTTAYPDEPFVLATEQPKIILPNRFLNELKPLSQDVLSLRREVYDKMHGRYTTLGTDHPIGIQAIRTDLTANIGRMLPELQEESAYALEREFGRISTWTQMGVYDKLLQLSALVNGRMFVGLPLSRDQDWIDISIGYTMAMVQGIRAIQRTKPLLRPFLVPFLPEMKALRDLQSRAAKILRPHYEFIIGTHQGADTEKKPARNQYNLISWMLKQMDLQRTGTDFDHLVHEQLFAVAWGRRVVAKDGIKLSNGQTMPPNATIGFVHPLAPYVKTPATLKSPLDYDPNQPPLSEFYPFRSYELRRLPGQENAHQFTQTGNDNLNFGHGTMSCPGRFFASAEAKCILIEFLRRYTVALGPGGEGEGGINDLKRPKNIVIPGNMQVVPNFTQPIYLKELPEVLPAARDGAT
ncbi:Cytochrome P450 CYP5315A1 [Metarhizium robertsii ARSEF 23]|uniref:Cytochrome P450 CYP5315A1 n=1 Tax=Metarhizium robertsii (strain ARSEF 23 / ATCC MYA-3075) TaxID=655844 RepID=E9EJE9_METRA|nr:Cytochrome P450 CYP5315A1 [Metarhizium robertsii ARSEF 23]EFZ04269.2 Cytochrome P450 CYP5315A1 [Metarhizium robertsii ARSEF 23]